VTDVLATTVLVTGGSGLLGSALLRLMADRDDLTVLAPRRSELDLLRPDEVTGYLTEHWPDAVIHLAADCGGIGYNRANPGSIMVNNLMMALNVFDAARTHNVSKVIAAGSCDSYPADAPLPWREDALWSGWPEPTSAYYAVAKRCLPALGEAFGQQYGLTSVHLIFINMFGEDDQFDHDRGHVIPATIAKIRAAQLRSDRQVTVWGDGTPRRELLYAGDAARAVLHALDHIDERQWLNVGSGDVRSVQEIIAEIATQMAWDGEFVFDPAHPNGHPLKVLDTNRLQASLGPGFEFTPFPDALRRTIAAFDARRQLAPP
jgi:GDP-L-fucose synthase